VECLEDQQVHPAFQEPVELLAERRPGGRVADTQVAVRGTAQGSNRPRDQGIAPGNVTRLARELGCPPVQPRGEIAQAPGPEPNAVCAEGRRLHDVRTRVEVFAVDRAHEVRPREDQLVEAGPLRDSAREEERAGGAVGDERASGQARPESVALRRADLPRIATLAHPAILPCVAQPTRRGPLPTAVSRARRVRRADGRA